MPSICICSQCSKLTFRDEEGKVRSGQYKSCIVQLRHQKKDQDSLPPQPASYDDDEIENDLAALENELKERHQDEQYEALQRDDSENPTTGKSISLPTDHQERNCLVD